MENETIVGEPTPEVTLLVETPVEGEKGEVAQ